MARDYTDDYEEPSDVANEYDYYDESYDEFENDPDAYDLYDIEALADEDGFEPLWEDLPFEERKMRVWGRYKLAAGLLDFISVIIGIIVILVVLMLAASLIQWLETGFSSAYKQLTLGL